MPMKPKKPCKYQGCPNLTDGMYCADHAQTENRRYNKYRRDPAINKRYDGEWRKIRAHFLAVNPLCELCKQDGWLTPATLVHHKQTLENGGTHDWGNLQALCQSCHSRLHAEAGDRWKPTR